jgi:hypothetical protein
MFPVAPGPLAEAVRLTRWKLPSAVSPVGVRECATVLADEITPQIVREPGHLRF